MGLNPHSCAKESFLLFRLFRQLSEFYFDLNLFLLNETWNGFKQESYFLYRVQKKLEQNKAFSQFQRLKSRNTYNICCERKQKNNLPTDQPTSLFNGRVMTNKQLLKDRLVHIYLIREIFQYHVLVQSITKFLREM